MDLRLYIVLVSGINDVFSQVDPDNYNEYIKMNNLMVIITK